MLNKELCTWIQQNQQLFGGFDRNADGAIDTSERAGIERYLKEQLFHLNNPETQFYMSIDATTYGPYVVADFAGHESMSGAQFVMVAGQEQWMPVELLRLYIRQQGEMYRTQKKWLLVMCLLFPDINVLRELVGETPSCVEHDDRLGTRRCEKCGDYFCGPCGQEHFPEGRLVCKKCYVDEATLRPFTQLWDVVAAEGHLRIDIGHMLAFLGMLGIGFALYYSPDYATHWGMMIVGLIISGSLFWSASRSWKYRNLITDTPLAKIKSAAQGWVKLSGLPSSPRFCRSPYFARECLAYEYKRERYRMSYDENKKGEWKTEVFVRHGVCFYLKDSTGKVFVNPAKAKIDFDKVESKIVKEGMTMNGAYRHTEAILVPDSLLALGYLHPVNKIGILEVVDADSELYAGPESEKGNFLLTNQNEQDFLSNITTSLGTSLACGAIYFLYSVGILFV